MSNKMPISWHQECLKNSRQHTEKKEAELVRLQVEVVKNKIDDIFHQKQIETAIAKGLDGFDRDKFMHKKSL